MKTPNLSFLVEVNQSFAYLAVTSLTPLSNATAYDIGCFIKPSTSAVSTMQNFLFLHKNEALSYLNLECTVIYEHGRGRTWRGRTWREQTWRGRTWRGRGVDGLLISIILLFSLFFSEKKLNF